MKTHIWVVESSSPDGWYPCWHECADTRGEVEEIIAKHGWREQGLIDDDGKKTRFRAAKYVREY